MSSPTSPDPDQPLYANGPTRAQLTDPASGWAIRGDLVPGYVALANDRDVIAEAGARMGDRGWLPAAAVRCGRAFRVPAGPVVPGLGDVAWPPGVDPRAWVTHETVADAAAAEAEKRAVEDRLAGIRAGRLCVRCGQVDGQYPTDAVKLLLDVRPPAGWRGGNAPTWCRDCAVAEVAALLDRVRAGSLA